MTEQAKATIQAQAKGHWQAGIAQRLAKGYTIVNPISCLVGNAKNYSIHYRRSFHNLLSRIEAAGYRIERKAGPRGGDYGATYRIAL